MPKVEVISLLIVMLIYHAKSRSHITTDSDVDLSRQK